MKYFKSNTYYLTYLYSILSYQVVFLISSITIGFYLGINIAKAESNGPIRPKNYIDVFFEINFIILSFVLTTIGVFMLVPFGFWFIQPRVNKIYGQYISLTDNNIKITNFASTKYAEVFVQIKNKILGAFSGNNQKYQEYLKTGSKLYIFKYFCTFKHYIIFIPFPIMLILQIIFFKSDYFASQFVIYYITLLFFGIWIFNLNRVCFFSRISKGQQPNQFYQKLFIIFLIVIYLFFIFMSYQTYYVISNFEKGLHPSEFMGNSLIFGKYKFLFDLLSLFFNLMALYVIIYTIRNFARVEKGINTTFDDYFGVMLKILFIPIGVWFLQPKINLYYEKYIKGKSEELRET
ncbi:MAG: hypothetical protein V1779_03810 [bacterium]